jgi:phosphohistidine phosphatase SixA
MKNSFRYLGFPLLLIAGSISFSACSYKVYVVRHAEKAGSPKNDPPLDAAGLRRSADLKQLLQDKKIRKIYSTQTARTMQTAAPLASQLNINVTPYSAKPDEKFVELLRKNKTNTLVVGHSNTVDDIVNLLAGETLIKGDLSEAVYDNLYIITLGRNGRKKSFVNEKFGSKTP